MSSAPKHQPRREGDTYYTPDDVAARCVRAIPGGVRGLRVWEPHAGGGAFARALVSAGAAWVLATDVDPEAVGRRCGTAGERPVGDFLTSDLATQVDWIVGNPPFTDAEAHVRHALALAPGVAFCLRFAFLESKKRAAFWREHPPAAVFVLSERPSFTGGGTDSAAYGFFVWHRHHIGPPVLGWVGE